MLQHWVYGLPSAQPLTRMGDSDLWHLFVELPRGSRIEYKLDVIRDDQGEWITDPLNPLKAEDPFGQNSVWPGAWLRATDLDDGSRRSPHGSARDDRRPE